MTVTKSPDAFRTISEVAQYLDLPQHVLRFWETRFSQIKPMKRGGGRRYYRPDDVKLLKGIQHLLYNEGYTIKGVQRILKDNGNKYVVAAGRGEDLSAFAAAPQDNQTTQPQTDQPISNGKSAVSVEEIISATGKSDTAGKKGKGLFKRLSGKESAAQNDDSKINVSGDEKKLLQATLYDLLECKRLLDQVR
ncbi:MAG: MerR family transcriptional regulator [Rhizobiaceae bacterium]|nr:MerR family transcriptional regulator [Rhizobiaceae bacterium]